MGICKELNGNYKSWLMNRDKKGMITKKDKTWWWSENGYCIL